MSLLLTEHRVCAYLGADRIVACRLAGRWRPRLMSTDVLMLEEGQHPVSVLSNWLASEALPPLVLDITLGLPHVRYVVLPWDVRRVKPSMHEAVGRSLLSRQFPDDAVDCAWRFAHPRYGAPQLGAAIPAVLEERLQELRDLFPVRGLQVSPLLARVLARFARSLRRSRAPSLLVVEQDRLVQATLAAGSVASLQVRPAPAAAALAAEMDKGARLFAPLQQPRDFVHPGQVLRIGRPDQVLAVNAEAAYALCGVI